MLELGAFISSRLLVIVFTRMFRRERYEDVLQRRADLMDLGARDSDAAKLCVDLGALHAFIDEQVHRPEKR